MLRRQHVAATDWFCDAMSLSDLLNDARERMVGWQHGWAARRGRLSSQQLAWWSNSQRAALDYSLSSCQRRQSFWTTTYPNAPSVAAVWPFTTTSAALHLQAAGMSLEKQVWLRQMSSTDDDVQHVLNRLNGAGARASATGRTVLLRVATGLRQRQLVALCKQARSGLDFCADQHAVLLQWSRNPSDDRVEPRGREDDEGSTHGPQRFAEAG